MAVAPQTSSSSSSSSSQNKLLKIALCYDPKSPPVASLFCLSLPRDKKSAVVETAAEGALGSEPRVEFNLDGNTLVQQATDIEIARLVCLSLPNCSVLIEFPPVEAASSASSCSASKTGAVGQSSCSEGSISKWLDFAKGLDASLSSSNQPVGAALKPLNDINNYLKDRTYLVGHRLSLADIALYSVIGKLFGFNNLTATDIPDLNSLINMQRWIALIDSINSIPPKVMKTVAAAFPGRFVAARSPKPTTAKPECTRKTGDSQNQTIDDQGSKKFASTFEGKLPDAVPGKVVVRFCPEPSGYLHIGHAKAALLNAYYAKAYNGKLLIRFDDTNPSKEKTEYEDAIIEDLQLLDINTDLHTRTSNYFTQTEAYCEKLLQQGVFYCDDTPVEQMRFERGEGIVSKCRDNSVEESLRRWGGMKKGSEEGLKNCVRAKIDMQSKNKCMRDPVMYRCNVDVPHQVHGTKYKAYPVYDFACPIVDSLEGVTHALRANEYADRIPQYQWVLNACQLPSIIIYEFSRLNLVNTVLSKRKLQWLVDHGAVGSWDDPRFPTVRGIRRRGLTPQALMEFIMEQGHSKNVNLMEWDKLWARNKQVIDPIVPRFMAVDVHAISVQVTNGPAAVETKERDLHPKNSSLGKGEQIYSNNILIEVEDAEMLEMGEEVTLMRWCNAIVEGISRNGAAVASVTMKLNPDGDFKTTKKKIHWISALAPKLPLKVILREYDHIISKKKPEEDDKIEEIYNKDSIFDTEAFADPAVSELKVGDVIQFERRGYFRVDQLKKDDTPMVFIKIPDGKCKAMSVVQTKIAAGKLTKGN